MTLSNSEKTSLRKLAALAAELAGIEE